MLDARCLMLDKEKNIHYYIQYPETSIQYHVISCSQMWLQNLT